MIPIHSNNNGKSYYDSKKKIIHTIFFNNVKVEEGLEIFKAVLKFVETHEIYGLFVNTSELKGSFSMVVDYMIDVYYNILIKCGLRYNAIIVPQDVFSYFSTENLLQRLKSIEVKTFSNNKVGLEWLEEKVLELHQ